MPTPRAKLPFTAVFTQRDVVAAGCTRAMVRGWRERGEVVTIANGVFAPSGMEKLDEVREIFQSRQVANGEIPVPVLGAARLHGLWIPPDPHPALRKPPTAVPDEYLHELHGLKVPSIAWTAMNLARWQQLPGVLVAFDSAIRLGADVGELRELANVAYCWPGSRDLASAVDHVDRLSGSALESWSRGLMIRTKLPKPVLQHRIRYRGRTYYADFCWPELGLIGEADGLSKYENANAIAGEKHRQEDLQALGYRIFRWTWKSVYPDSRPWRHALALQLQGSATRWRHRAS